MNTSAHIPALIIQTGRSRDLDLLAKAAVRNIQLLHPDWEYMFFDDDDVVRFVATEFPHYKKLFDSFPRRIQRFDFFRYLAVLRHGGFYFDLDVFLADDLSPLRSESCVFPFEELTLSPYLRNRHGMDWELGNYAFGAAPGHPFLQAVVENCVRAQQDPDWAAPMMSGIPRLFRQDFEVLNTTGPGLVSRTFAENTDASRHVRILFPNDVCDARQWHHFGTYGIHAMEGSWRDRGSFLRRKLAQLWERRTRNRLLIESQRRGPSRLHDVAALA